MTAFHPDLGELDEQAWASSMKRQPPSIAVSPIPTTNLPA
jgi:hypothetical protein